MLRTFRPFDNGPLAFVNFYRSCKRQSASVGRTIRLCVSSTIRRTNLKFPYFVSSLFTSVAKVNVWLFNRSRGLETLKRLWVKEVQLKGKKKGIYLDHVTIKKEEIGYSPQFEEYLVFTNDPYNYFFHFDLSLKSHNK